MLVDSESIHIEIFRLNANNHWELEEYNKDAQTVLIQAINTPLSIEEIYEGTELFKQINS